MPVRRNANPSDVQHIWDAIQSAQIENAIPDLQILTKFFQTHYELHQKKVELYLGQAVKDGLIT